MYPVFCQQILHFFLVLTNSFFHEKSLLSNFNPPLLHSYRQNPNIEPWTAYFYTRHANDFCQHSEPCFYPCFYFSSNNGGGAEGGGGSNVKGYESKFNQNSHRYSPAQSLCFLTHYTATKNSFTLLEIIIGQEKIHGCSVQPQSTDPDPSLFS